MTIPKYLAAALLAALTFSSCALESEKAAARAKIKAEEDARATAARQAAAAAEALKNPPTSVAEDPSSTVKESQGLDFADPDTTKTLITAETTKTVTGPLVKKEIIPDTESVINVAPPLPRSQLPEPESN